MKEGKTVLFPMFLVGIVCIVAMVVGLFLMWPVDENSQKGEPEDSVFAFQELKDLESVGLKESPDGSYKINDATAYGYDGTVSVKVKESSVSSISFTTTLFAEELLTASEAKNRVEAFVEAYSKEYGFSSDSEPILVQFTSDENFDDCPEDSYEALIQGYVMFERSYRDAEGILWILQIYSPKENVLVGTINKYPDDSGFADFVPQEIIQKEVFE